MIVCDRCLLARVRYDGDLCDRCDRPPPDAWWVRNREIEVAPPIGPMFTCGEDGCEVLQEVYEGTCIAFGCNSRTATVILDPVTRDLHQLICNKCGLVQDPEN